MAAYPLIKIPGLVAGSRRVNLAEELVAGLTNFDYTGAIVERAVPEGCYAISWSCWGAAAANGNLGVRTGGGGGHARGIMNVVPGDIIAIYAGQGGLHGTDNTEGGAGGWPDGGDGAYAGATAGSGGGGGSRIYLNGVLYGAAGGGGGDSDGSLTDSDGGRGGGQSGFPGGTETTGGSQIAGGVNSEEAGNSGAAFQGGRGWTDTSRFVDQGTGDYAGGGGGGYYGGAGGANGGGGAGGSGFAKQDGANVWSESFQDSSLGTRGRDDIGWNTPIAQTSGVSPSNGNHGRVSISCHVDAEDVYLGRTAPGIAVDQNGTTGTYRMRKYRVPQDMWLTHVTRYFGDSFDSNSDAGAGTTTFQAAVYSANSAGVPSNMIAFTEVFTATITGANTIPLAEPVFLRQNDIVFIGAVAGTNNYTESQDAGVINSGEGYTFSSQTVGALVPSSHGITATAQTAQYQIGGFGYIELNKADDYAIAVHPFTTSPDAANEVSNSTADSNSTALKTQIISTSKLGGRVPKAVIIMGTWAQSGSDFNGVVTAVGAATRYGHQWAYSANHEDAQASTDCNSEQREGRVISMASPGEIVAILNTTIQCRVTDWFANGIEITYDDVSGVPHQFVAIFLAGDTMEVWINEEIDFANGANLVDRIGFHPTFGIQFGEASNAGNGDGDNAVYSMGLGFFDSAGNQGCFGAAQLDGQPAGSQPGLVASNTRVETQQSPSAATHNHITVGSLTDDGLTYTAGAALGNTDTYQLLFYIPGAQARVFSFTTPTSTGSVDYTTPGFNPDLTMLIGTSNESWDTSVFNTAEASGFGFGAYDDTDGVGFSVFNEAGADPTNCACGARTNQFRIGRGTSLGTVAATFSHISTGFNLNYSAVHTAAVRGVALCVGPESSNSP